jgi:DNA-directed RNA polymerase sigma subunit (sigma70/sigma32)
LEACDAINFQNTLTDVINNAIVFSTFYEEVSEMSQAKNRGSVPGSVHEQTQYEIEKIERYLFQQIEIGVIPSLKDIEEFSNLSLPYICKIRKEFLTNNAAEAALCSKVRKSRCGKLSVKQQRAAAREYIEKQLKAGFVPIIEEISRETGINNVYAKEIRKEYQMPRRSKLGTQQWHIAPDPIPRMKHRARNERTIVIEREIHSLISRGIPPNFAEIGDRHGLSRERIRQIAYPLESSLKALYEANPDLSAPSRRRK